MSSIFIIFLCAKNDERNRLARRACCVPRAPGATPLGWGISAPAVPARRALGARRRGPPHWSRATWRRKSMKGIAKKRIAQFEGLKKKWSVIDIDVLRSPGKWMGITGTTQGWYFCLLKDPCQVDSPKVCRSGLDMKTIRKATLAIFEFLLCILYIFLIFCNCCSLLSFHYKLKLSHHQTWCCFYPFAIESDFI